MPPVLPYLFRRHRRSIILFALVLLIATVLALFKVRSNLALPAAEVRVPLTAEEKRELVRNLASTSPDVVDLATKVETVASLEEIQAMISDDDKLMIMRSLNVD